VAVSLGTLPVAMLVDTGATNMTVTQSIAYQLLASGQATRAADSTMTMADGSARQQQAIIINTMTIGGHVLHTVWATVSPNGADMLLGFSILNRVSGKFAINVANSTLDFE
jgi:clan AA aspartic protease (TIGR02281 family)